MFGSHEFAKSGPKTVVGHPGVKIWSTGQFSDFGTFITFEQSKISLQ